MKKILSALLKILVCGLAFFIGTILGGMLAGAAGLPAPDMPQGTDAGTLSLYLLLASLGMGALLAYLAARISGTFLYRWLALVAFSWVIYSLTTYLEASIYTTFSSASPYKVVMDAAAFLLSAGLAARFFPARPRPETGTPAVQLSLRGWAWRLALAWAAFPIIYLGFGKIVEPYVIEVYRQGQLEMTAPGWGQIIPMQMLRSLLFLVICLALITAWNRGRKELWAALSGSLFLLVGGFYMLQAYWFPAGFRAVHSLEILADSVVYGACLIILFYPEKQARSSTANDMQSAGG